MATCNEYCAEMPEIRCVCPARPAILRSYRTHSLAQWISGPIIGSGFSPRMSSLDHWSHILPTISATASSRFRRCHLRKASCAAAVVRWNATATNLSCSARQSIFSILSIASVSDQGRWLIPTALTGVSGVARLR